MVTHLVVVVYKAGHKVREGAHMVPEEGADRREHRDEGCSTIRGAEAAGSSRVEGAGLRRAHMAGSLYV